MRNLTTATGLLTGGIVLCGLIAGGGDAEEPNAAFKPVASVHGLMTGQGLVFKELQAAIQDPKTPHRDEQIMALSEALAELANVNTYNKDKDDYRGWAGKVRDVCLELSGEAKKSPLEEPRLKELLKAVKDTCTACHDLYQ